LILSLIGNNLTCTRGDTTVFSALEFSVEPGDALIVRGANGSGKSSLLRLTAGYLAPTKGELRRDGVLVSEEPERHLTRLHYVGHLDALKPAFTVVENLTFWSRLFSGETVPAASISRALDRMGLSALSDMPTHYLSAGQRRRLALARLVASSRPLWLLDEPTASLDDAGSETLVELIAEHRLGGGMVMAAVHGGLAVPDVTTVRLGRQGPGS
jgi:heme exporter protein A